MSAITEPTGVVRVLAVASLHVGSTADTLRQLLADDGSAAARLQ